MGSLRTPQARARPSRSVRQPEEFAESLQNELADILDNEPPRKRVRTARKQGPKLRWIPGGRGGGGRHVGPDDPDYATAIIPKEKERKGRRRAGGRETNRSMAPAPRTSTRARSARGGARPRYSTAAAASAAVAHGDGYKPREERGWEEFHADLDLDSCFAVIESEDVDGIKRPEQASGIEESDEIIEPGGFSTPSRKRPGRPMRRGDSMLNSLLTPEPPKFVPIPAPNPRERLTLPKPSYRELDPFLTYEQKEIAALNFVDKTMASVGYQEGEMYLRPERTLIRQMEGSAEEDLDLSPALAVEGENSAIGSSGVGRVEYDMDEQDVKWLEALNRTRIKDGVGIIKPAVFEITMTKVEKEWHALEKRIPKPNPKAPQTQRPRSSSAAAVKGEPGAGEEPDSKCAICDDGDCENANAIVFCDGCDLAVHQECYGVPYIPEGQWLCRKCQLVGSARPSCIFCPNEGGAFKQTNNSKWAHLLCATWIPEVNIGNPSLMEPITDVEKVPPGRWKLHCYICRQAMGACIQCSDARCYDAFHLTCARQAGLYLRMKTGGGTNTLMESSTLRAYCHRHSPLDWRSEHNTDKAIIDATTHYKKHFKNQIWADSRASALAVSDTQPVDGSDSGVQRVILTNKKGQKQKTIWRLPSGAPVIPEVLLKSIEESLVRFMVQKKKDYVSEICKYWTLKREARRGAALLKRLQLQMDTFSSFEVTRRDYKAQGATGRARLQRRIQFAETLAADLERIKAMCELVKQREAEKLEDAMMLKQIVDIVYFPIPLLLWPILEKAFKHDTRKMYTNGLRKLHSKLVDRVYTSVAPFSADLARVFAADLGLQTSSTADLQSQIWNRHAPGLTSEEKEQRAMARRLIKTVQPLLEEALRKEAELTGRPYEQQIKEMDEMIFSRRASLSESVENAQADAALLPNGTNRSTPAIREADVDVEMQDPCDEEVEYINGHAFPIVKPAKDVSMVDADPNELTNGATFPHVNGDIANSIEVSTNTPPASTNGIRKDGDSNSTETKEGILHEPPTPPMSMEGNQAATISQGGIPWYVEAFDPVGTTIHDERWMGQEVLRAMSEELSEMDDDELTGLGVQEPETITNENTVPDGMLISTPGGKKKPAKKALKKKGNDWGGRSFKKTRGSAWT